MMSKTRDSRETIEDLLERGLDLYGQNLIDDALQCWNRVLALCPDHPQACDYLACAGAAVGANSGAQVIEFDRVRSAQNQAPDAPSPPLPRVSIPPLSSDGPAEEGRRKPSSARRRFIENLMHNGRYEEALAVLYKARAENPGDVKLSKTIRLMRERLALHYTSQLSNLDLVPLLDREDNKRKAASLLAIDERQVLNLIDGISSYGDIVSSCSLGRLSTLRILARLHHDELLTVAEDAPPQSQAISSQSSWRPPSSAASNPTAPNPTASNPTAPNPAAPARSESLSPSSRDPFDPPPGEVDRYAELFSAATTAYLVRDLRRAQELFVQCSKMRPDDRRVLHNLSALEKKLNQ